jgi:hypothetical protein
MQVSIPTLVLVKSRSNFKQSDTCNHFVTASISYVHVADHCLDCLAWQNRAGEMIWNLLVMC